jgi:hypothetical protein
LNVQVKEIEIIDVNYIYEFISERECKTITKIIMNVPPNIDRYNHSINNIIYGLKVTDYKGVELTIVDNEKTKRKYQSNDNEKIKLQRGDYVPENKTKTITVLLFPSDQHSEGGYENFEINISYTLYNNSQFNGFFKDSIEYKEFLIGNGCNLITQIKVPQHYNIDIKTLKMTSLESEQTHNKIVPFNFILKDSRHIIIQSTQNTKIDFIILMWKIIIHKINLNWIRFGFYSWSFIIIFIPLVIFLHLPSVTSIVGALGGLLASLLAIRLRNMFEISLVERWNNIYIWMLVAIIIESSFIFFVRFSLSNA